MGLKNAMKPIDLTYETDRTGATAAATTTDRSIR
jgi:hypothetical protein